MKLFELEVPEISEGIVSIVACAREPGMRAKIAVSSRDSNVDPVGACVGMKGSRVQSVVNELRGEKIDIVTYSENPAKFVCNALAPAEVTKVIIDEDSRSMQIVVADDQLSLAIGKRGQNVRLAVQLSGWRLDIQSETKWTEISEIAKSVFARVPQIPSGAVDLLIKSGYMDIEELADAKPEDLTRFPGIDLKRAEEIIGICNHILDHNEWPLPEVEPEKVKAASEVKEEKPRAKAKLRPPRLEELGMPADSDRDESARSESDEESERADEEQEKEKSEPAPAPPPKVTADGSVPVELLIDLMKLDGVGLKSAEALFKAGFLNREKLRNVTMDDLLAVPGLGLDIAQRIAETIKQQG